MGQPLEATPVENAEEFGEKDLCGLSRGLRLHVVSHFPDPPDPGILGGACCLSPLLFPRGDCSGTTRDVDTKSANNPILRRDNTARRIVSSFSCSLRHPFPAPLLSTHPIGHPLALISEA